MLIKQTLTLFWKGFIYGGCLTSLGAMSIAFTTAILLKIKISWEYLVSVFLAAEIIYLFNRHREIEKDSLVNRERTEYFKKYDKYISLFIVLLFFLFVRILITSYKMYLLIFGILLTLFGLFYSIFLKNLTKNIIGFKDFFVSLWWATIVIFVFLFSPHNGISPLLLVFLFVWINIFVQEVFLDIKDVETDRRYNLLTLPLILNKNLLFYILFLLTVVANIPIFYGAYFHLLPLSSLVLSFTIPYNYSLLKRIDQIYKDPKHLEVLIDVEKILYGILVFIFYKVL